MKKLLLLLLLSQTFYAQKTYKFDYVLELENKTKTEKKDSISFILLNSKDNSFFCNIIELDSLNYELIFKNYDKMYSRTIAKKKL